MYYLKINKKIFSVIFDLEYFPLISLRSILKLYSSVNNIYFLDVSQTKMSAQKI